MIHPLFNAPSSTPAKPSDFDNLWPHAKCTHGRVTATIYEGASPEDAARAAEFLLGEARRLGGAEDGITPGLRQIIEWARTYVDGETCIGEVPRNRLSPEELAGLAELERLETLL